jgi:ABC-type sugar transport system substrate-binding protein
MKRVALLLADENNLYQRHLVQEARAAAGSDVELMPPRFAGGLGMSQTAHIFEVLRATPRVDALLIMVAGSDSNETAFQKLVREGIACVFLNRTPAFLAQLRTLSPGTLVGSAKPDQQRIGTIQAEQCLRLRPGGGFVLLMLGAKSTASAIERRSGFIDAIGRQLEIHELEGNWTRVGAETALGDWYRLGADRQRRVDAMVCQNDLMAEGVRAVLAARRAAAVDVPILGCDGLPEEGRALVERRAIAATVVMPPTTPAALEMLKDHWAGRAARNDVVLEPASYPPLAQIRWP